MEEKLELISRVKHLMEMNADTANSFAIKVGIDPGNLRKKLAGERNITKKDILKICNSLGISRSWLEDGKGDTFVSGCSYSLGRDINIASNVDNSIRKAMSAGNDTAFSRAAEFFASDKERSLERENELLRKQLASKDEQIKRLLDMLANKQ